MAKKSIRPQDSIEFDAVDNVVDIALPAEEKIEIPVSNNLVKSEKKITVVNGETKELINPLRNEKLEVRLVRHNSAIVNSTSDKHVMSGGMADGASRYYCVPTQRNGTKVNVLTNNEKAFFEDLFNLEPGALNVTRKVDNYWDDFEVKVTKYGTILDLSDPIDYIKYKVLLANKSKICPSLKELTDNGIKNYDFVLCGANDEADEAARHMSITMKCYKEYGKVEEKRDLLRVVIETMEGMAIPSDVRLSTLQSKCNDLIQRDAKLFYATITDELLPFKVIIKQGLDHNIIIYRGKDLYLRDGSIPLCEDNQNPTFLNAAKFISKPQNKDILFAIQSKCEL